MRISLRWKLISAFLLVVLVSSSLMSVWLHGMVEGAFSKYIQNRAQTQAKQLLPILENYYSQHGSWEGVQQVLNIPPDKAARLFSLSSFSSHFLLLNRQKRVIWDSHALFLGRLPVIPLSPVQLARNALDIKVNGQVVGQLVIIPPKVRALGSMENFFLRSVNRSFVEATLLAGILAVLLGALASQLLIRPLQSLASAAKSVAKGDFSRRVDINSYDEIGDLGYAFNQMAATLAENEHLREKLIADIAHELRTPLSVIRGNLEAFLDGVYDLTPDNIASVYDETMLLERLVNDLRELSLADSGQLRMNWQLLRVETLVNGVVDFFRPAAESKEVALSTMVSEDLPPIQGDVQRLKQVLHNLLSNALRYTPKGGKITVHVSLVADKKQQIAISVEDDGPGIPAEELTHIFDRFFRNDPSRSRCSGGSGLGLAIVKELVEAHGGRIWAESQVGRGTVITFTIPIVSVPPGPNTTAE